MSTQAREGPPTSTAPTPYERIGGGPALRLAVDRFYAAVVSDPDLAPYFVDIELSKLKAHQAALLTKLLGGPDGYAGRDLADGHRGLGITDEHYAKVGAHLIGVLTDLSVPDDIIAAIGETLQAVRPQIVENPNGHRPI
jgi:hemoglobin